MRQVKQNNIPLSCHIELFLKTIDPILLFGSEIWGFEKHQLLESFRLKCLKCILRVKSSTPTYMVYGELGILPLSYEIKARMIGYWGRLFAGNENKMSSIVYFISRERNKVHSKNLDGTTP